MNADVSRRERFKALFGAIALAVVVLLVAPPVVQAATQAVKVKGKVKIADTDGDTIESAAIPAMGLLAAKGSDGAIATRTFAGGGGFLGAANCDPSDDDGGLVNFVEVGNAIATGIIITGTDGVWRSTSAALGGGNLPLLEFRVNENEPNVFVGLGNGLTLTAPLKFTCISGTDSNIVVLGQ